MTLTYPEVVKMKNAVNAEFHLNVHFHDACGGQYFSLDEKPSERLKSFIVEYFENQNIMVTFSPDFLTFVLK